MRLCDASEINERSNLKTSRSSTRYSREMQTVAKAKTLDLKNCLIPGRSGALLRELSWMQWLHKWCDWHCAFNRGEKMRLQLYLRRLLICISVAQQSRFAPSWADDGKTDRKAHHNTHG